MGQGIFLFQGHSLFLRSVNQTNGVVSFHSMYDKINESMKMHAIFSSLETALLLVADF